MKLLKTKNYYYYNIIGEYSLTNLIQDFDKVYEFNKEWISLFWKYITTVGSYTLVFKLTHLLVPLMPEKFGSIAPSATKDFFWYSEDWNDILQELGNCTQNITKVVQEHTLLQRTFVKLIVA